MNDKCSRMDNALKVSYTDWLSEIQEKAPDLLGEKYSNPYYSCVPKGWADSKVRILIVGEEGAGYWGRGKDTVSASDIDMGQTFCWSSLSSYLKYPLEYDLYPKALHFAYNRSAFWNRARKLSKYGVCAWTNIDLIHIRSDKSGKCALSEKERKLLHSVDNRILAEQIGVLKPTHVVYAGWYGISLQHELPELFNRLYPGGLGDSSVWNKSVITLKQDDVYHIFTYHPNWGTRHKGYENRVMEAFQNTL